MIIWIYKSLFKLHKSQNPTSITIILVQVCGFKPPYIMHVVDGIGAIVPAAPVPV